MGNYIEPKADAINSIYIATLGKGGRVLKIGHAQDADRRVKEFNEFRLSNELQWVLHTDQPIGSVQDAIRVEKKIGEIFEEYRNEPNNNEIFVNLDPDKVLVKLATLKLVSD